MPNFCNPEVGDPWVDGFNTFVKEDAGTRTGAGTVLQSLKGNGII